MQEASPRRRTEPTMNKLTSLALLAPLALTAFLVGCAGAPDEEEDTSSVAQASSTITTGTWSGLPAAKINSLQNVTCKPTYGSSLKFSLGYMGNQTYVFLDMTASLEDGSTLTSAGLTPNKRVFFSGTTTKITASSNKGSFNLVLATTDQGQLTLGITDGWLSSVGHFTCPTTMVYEASAPVASDVTYDGNPYVGGQFQGHYTFSDTSGVSESGSTYQWYRLSSGTTSAISGATSLNYTNTAADAGNQVKLCVTPADAYSVGAEACSDWIGITYACSASDVGISGDPLVGSTLTGTYTFNDVQSYPDASTYQWYTVVSGVSTAISGATSATYTPTSSQINSDLSFCVTPADIFGPGVEVCSSTVTVPGIVWYSGVGATGTSAEETISNGTCVSMSSIGMANNTLSVDLYGLASNQTTLVMYKTSNCTGTSYTRYAGADTVHAISLNTVGIGSNTLSYKVSW
jgi:hypothetical protein